MQNNWIFFCLRLVKMHHFSEEDFKTINWLPVDQRVQQSLKLVSAIFKRQMYFFVISNEVH